MLSVASGRRGRKGQGASVFRRAGGRCQACVPHGSGGGRWVGVEVTEHWPWVTVIPAFLLAPWRRHLRLEFALWDSQVEARGTKA